MGGCESTTTYYYDRCGAFGCYCLTGIFKEKFGGTYKPTLGDGECDKGERFEDVHDARQDCYVRDYFFIHLWILVGAVGVALILCWTVYNSFQRWQEQRTRQHIDQELSKSPCCCSCPNFLKFMKDRKLQFAFSVLLFGVICTCSLVLIAAGATASKDTVKDVTEKYTGRASFRYKDPIKAMFYIGWILTGLAALGVALSEIVMRRPQQPSNEARIHGHGQSPNERNSHQGGIYCCWDEPLCDQGCCDQNPGRQNQVHPHETHLPRAHNDHGYTGETYPMEPQVTIETQPRPTSHHIPLRTHERIHRTTLNPDFLSGDQNPSHHDERSQGALHTHHSTPELHHNEAPSSQNPHQAHMHNQSDISSLHDQQEQRNADGELPVCTESETLASDCNNETHEEGELPPTYTDAPTTGSTNKKELSELPDLTVVNWLDSQFDPMTHHQTRHHRGDSSA